MFWKSSNLLVRIRNCSFKRQSLHLKYFSLSALTAGKLDGKIAIVTASTYGIGLSIAKKMVMDGAKVMISSRKEQHVKEALEQLQQLGIPKDNIRGTVCHVGDKQHRTELIQHTLKHFGGVDILVSNAAVNPHVGPVLDCPETMWDKIFDINVKAPFLLTKEIYPLLVKRKGGSIIFISSIAGFTGIPEIGAYSVSKTALFGLTKVLANQLGNENIRVNCIAPGVIKTKFSQVIQDNPGSLAGVTIPLKRYGEPDEIGGLASFLASNEASYITGENIVIAGGITTRL